MATSPTTKSALTSGAAKDDSVGAPGHYTFTIQDLLANDPGGAAKVDVTKQFLFGTTEAEWANQTKYLLDHGITYDAKTGIYTITSDATDFQYMVQIGNKGTWSTAHVDVTAPEPEPVATPHLSGIELLKNWDFEQDHVDLFPGYADLNSIAGWQNEGGTSQPMQVQHESFGFVTGFAEGEHQWLDTSASPGNVHIGQDVDVGTGVKAQLRVSVAAEDIVFNNGASIDTYRPDADDHLLFKFNGTVVQDISLEDFTVNGQVDWNHFKDFTVDVTGSAGMDHFEIESTGMTQYTDASGVIHGYAGFAVDHVSLQEWII